MMRFPLGNLFSYKFLGIFLAKISNFIAEILLINSPIPYF